MKSRILFSPFQNKERMRGKKRGEDSEKEEIVGEKKKKNGITKGATTNGRPSILGV